MFPRMKPVFLALAALGASFVALDSPRASSPGYSPVGLALYSNPPEVPPGGTLYAEAVVTNKEPVPLDFQIWGGVFSGDELLIEIPPVPGFLYAWGEELFPVPALIPLDMALGEYRLVISVGASPEEVWVTQEKPFLVKFPPPVKASLHVAPRVIFPWMDVWANLFAGNMTPEPLEFTYRGIIMHENRIVAEIPEGDVSLAGGESTVVPLFVDLPEGLVPGLYRIHITLGQGDLTWLVIPGGFEVTHPSPVGLSVFVNPLRLGPGETAWVSAIVRNESEERLEFRLWGSVTHREILYKEFLPIPVELAAGEERLIPLEVEVIEAAPEGAYRVWIAVGPEVGIDWMVAESKFWVKREGRRPGRTD